MRQGRSRIAVWNDKPPLRLVLFRLLAFAVLLAPGGTLAQTTDLVDRSALRVCSDPANLPFSNEKGEGFENRLADLIGKKLGLPVVYTWFPQVTGFIRNTLRLRKCDLVMGYAQGHELVQNTNHYYRSVYVLLYRSESELAGVDNLDDPRLKDKSIGIVAGTPPATIMALNGLMGKAKPFHLVVDRRYTSPGEQMMTEISEGVLDAGILWGPIGGYYAKRSDVPIAVVPLVKESKGPRMAYRITMGLRPNEPEWKHQLNALIAAHQQEINTILLDFGVPILDENDNRIRN